MLTRYFALIFGIIYIAVGVLGFVPALYSHPPASAPHVSVTSEYGYLLGLFPVNVLHDIVHLLVGLAGLAAYSSFTNARLYARTLAIVYGLLTILGFIPTLDTVFGLIPIFGNDIWLHALSAIVAAYIGWFAPGEGVTDRVRAATR